MHKKKKEMIILGLTGGIGSGKSTISKHLKNKRIPVFDSDKEVNSLYVNKNKDLLKTISKIFKEKEIIRANKISKEKIGNIVFENPRKLKKLEKTIFKELRKRRKTFLKHNKKLEKKIVVLDAPLLFENKIHKMCNYVVFVKTPLKKRISRILKRKGMTIKKARKIIKRQMPERKKERLADFVVQTKAGKCYTIKKIDKIIKKLL